VGKIGASSQSTTPGAYELSQNHPNPFNPTTEINFAIREAGEVRLVIYNLSGQVVRTLVSGQLVAGTHRVTWNATDDSGIRVANGVYLYMLKVGSATIQKKLVLLK
jgi:flagellar hook assembly protein FlgD